MSRLTRTRFAVPVLLITTLALTGCGSDEQAESAKASPTPSAQTTVSSAQPASGKSEMIMVTGGRITPQGKLVQLQVGETLNLEIMADEAGELHVHSTPDQTIEFPSGTTNHELVFDRPGVVEVEDHHTGDLVLKLQIR
jgi:hypothetical protein